MALYFYDIDNTNPSIVYSTGWNEYPDVKAYGGSVTSTFSQATASFSFTGMAVSVQCDKLFDFETNDSAMFNVDNGPWTPILVSDSTEPYTCWSSGGLNTEGQHILNVKNVGGGTPLRIDKITYMVYVPETPSSSSMSSTMINTGSSTLTLSDLSPSQTNIPSPTSSPSSESTANMPNKKSVSVAVVSLVLSIVGFFLLFAYIKKRRSRHRDAILDAGVFYLPSQTQDVTSGPMTQCTMLNDPHLPRPEPAYAIPFRNAVGGAVFPSRRPAYDLESNIPNVMTPKRSKLRDTILFPRLTRNPVRSAGV